MQTREISVADRIGQAVAKAEQAVEADRPPLVERAIAVGNVCVVQVYRRGGVLSDRDVLLFESDVEAEECARVLLAARKPIKKVLP